jgi:uncharacterized protein
MADGGKRAGLRSGARLREIVTVAGPAALVAVIGFVIAYQFVEPAPPDSLTIATGGQGGGYYAAARRYREILAREGVRLEVLESRGSVDNLQRLKSPGGVDVAFIQGGIAGPDQGGGLVGLASLYYEPLWVFYRAPLALDLLSGLRGRRIALGGEGSGTRAVALKLLAANGVDGGNATLLPVGGATAAAALREGRIDAAFFVTAPGSATVRGLLAAEGVRLMSFSRADAYRRNYRFLSRITLPRGAIDLALDRPEADKILIAPAATLVARAGLHPALVALLLQAATEVHRPGGLLEAAGTFPSARFVDVALSDDAARFLARGPPFLQRYLPFWLANLVDRLIILLIPLVTLLIPLLRILPPAYRWRMRARIFRWYRELRALEARIHPGLDDDERRTLNEALQRIEREVQSLSVPLTYSDAVYTLRHHIELVRTRLAGEA